MVSEMFLKTAFIVLLGICAGLMVSAGVFTVLFVVGLIPRFAAKTKTAKYEIIYGNNGCWYPRGEDLCKMLRCGNYIHGITALVHKDCFQKVGFFDDKLRCTQDYEMWFRIAKEYTTYLIPTRLAQTRIHPNQVGNVRRNHCAVELENSRKKLLSTVSLNDLFPNDIRKHSEFYCKVYLKYLRFCVMHNIPSLRDGLFSLSKKVLPKTFICKIVRALDRGD